MAERYICQHCEQKLYKVKRSNEQAPSIFLHMENNRSLCKDSRLLAKPVVVNEF